MEIIKILKKKKNAQVALVKILNDPAEYVLKYYNEFSRSMFIEINILATSSHNNIIRLTKLVPCMRNGIHIANNDNVGMLLPKLDCTLSDIFYSNKYSPQSKIHYLQQIAHGIRYLHSNNIIHCDIKPENIMLEDDVVKIIDFGSAEYIFSDKIKTTQTKCTVTHRAPEGFIQDMNGFYEITKKFDIWSFGIILFEIFSGSEMYKFRDMPKYQPDGTSDYDKIYEKIANNYFTSHHFMDSVRKYLPKNLWDVFNIDPEKRPDINFLVSYLNKFLPKKFDENIYPKIYTCNIANRDCNSYQKYMAMLNQIEDNELSTIYPDIIIYATFDLLHRLAITEKKLSDEYIYQAIFLCNNFNTSSFNISIKKIFPEFKKVNRKIICDILLKTNGAIFQYYYYLYKNDNYKNDATLLASQNYCKYAKNLIDTLENGNIKIY